MPEVITTGPSILSITDCFTGEKCPTCGSTEWIVDGDIDSKKAWFLCMDPFNQGCVTCRDLPENTIVTNFQEV